MGVWLEALLCVVGQLPKSKLWPVGIEHAHGRAKTICLTARPQSRRISNAFLVEWAGVQGYSLVGNALLFASVIISRSTGFSATRITHSQ
ncbi:hypothetical protein VNO77_44529 [Canavalia gladiata]|uniref:Uncharacterized protein n=1 Tax=Canavalia gladiata TaxID=3824 RepID=A0AAN9JW42_CANGL